MQVLGKNSLMVYWVHVMLVYGNLVMLLKQRLSIPATALATAVVIALMVGLSEAWLRRKARQSEKWREATAVAGAPRPATI
jgi:hypothetical protein